MKMKVIQGTDALEVMRNLKVVPGAYFSMVHLRYNQKDEKQGARLVQRCRLRAAMADDVFDTDADLYLPYEDLEQEHTPRMCFKILIRRVAFPPEFEWMKVVWTEE